MDPHPLDVVKARILPDNMVQVLLRDGRAGSFPADMLMRMSANPMKLEGVGIQTDGSIQVIASVVVPGQLLPQAAELDLFTRVRRSAQRMTTFLLVRAPPVMLAEEARILAERVDALRGYLTEIAGKDG